MLEQIHFLLSYTCNYECDHCFLYCSPSAEGTFTIKQIEAVLLDAKSINTVEWIYFEGGEPFLYYPIMLKGLQLAKELGFKSGIVTNNYWATSIHDAKLWLKPIIDSKIDDLSLSQDTFHQNETDVDSAQIAIQAAKELGYKVNTICIEEPTVQEPTDSKGEPVIGGGVLLKGRAVEKLTEGLPTKPVNQFTQCKYEELENPVRVHIDSYGNVQVCQGISIGNFMKEPLSQIINEYNFKEHPICAPIVEGGPFNMAKNYNLNLSQEFSSECHYCYSLRCKLIKQFPDHLAPQQVYGLTY